MKEKTIHPTTATPVMSDAAPPIRRGSATERQVLLAAVSLLGLSVGVAAAQQPSAAPHTTPAADAIDTFHTKVPSNQNKAPSNQIKAPSNQIKAPSNQIKAPSNQIKAPSNQLKKPTG
jgi:uncharacterized protein HemX